MREVQCERAGCHSERPPSMKPPSCGACGDVLVQKPRTETHAIRREMLRQIRDNSRLRRQESQDRQRRQSRPHRQRGLCWGRTPHDPARTRHARDDRRLRRWRLLRPQHVNTPPSSATRGGTGIQPGQGNRQRFGGRNCVRNRRAKTAIRSSGLARLLQTCRRAPPIRKSNRRGPHSPATRSTDRGGQQTQGERRAASTVQLLYRQSEQSLRLGPRKCGLSPCPAPGGRGSGGGERGGAAAGLKQLAALMRGGGPPGDSHVSRAAAAPPGPGNLMPIET